MVPAVPTTASAAPALAAGACATSATHPAAEHEEHFEEHHEHQHSSVDVAFVRDASRVEHARRIGITWLRNVCRVQATRVESAEVVISELITNAVLHGRSTTVGLRLRHVDGQVRLEVNDHSPSGIPRSKRVGPDEESGRGLWLVDALVDELGGSWGFTDDGTVAWCVFPS
ncbi:ATP-binding protein [Streptomyces vastus]